MSTGRARAWLELMRISNLPTVVSNTIAGTVLGVIVRIIEDDGGCAVWFGETPLRTDARAPSLAAMAAAIVAPAIAKPSVEQDVVSLPIWSPAPNQLRQAYASRSQHPSRNPASGIPA